MRKTLLALALLAVFAAPALGYDMTDLRRDMKAQTEKMLKEVGDVTMTQELTFEDSRKGMSGMNATTYVKGARWRSNATMRSSEKDMPEMEMVTLFDGDDMWSVMMGMKRKLPKGAVGQGGPTALWNEFPDDAKVLGEEKVGDRDCWKVEYDAPKGAPGSGSGKTTLWLLKSTFMPIQMENKVDGKPARTVMSDFRKVKGYEIPHLTEMFSGDKKMMTMKIVKIETGKGLSDDLFDAEKLEGGDGMDMNAMMKKAMEMQEKMEGKAKKGGE